MSTNPIQALQELREYSGSQTTGGLSDSVIQQFWEEDGKLQQAVTEAVNNHRELRSEFGSELKSPEKELFRILQADYVNFYPATAVSPYVPLAAAGPWIVTTHGAVLHDSGGYGMLGLGHAPEEITEALSRNWVMANVMGPHFNQKRLADRLQREIGHSRGSCPFSHFICMNSGSEAISVAARIVDINAANQTGNGALQAGKTIKQLSLEEGFHGRTFRAAMVSDSTNAVYREHLASFRDSDTLVTVPPNDVDGLRRVFQEADDEAVFFDAFYMEPVMGEGVPGLGITREFYDLARQLTRERGTLLIVDSIQAALRAHGCLSIIDYPGYEDCEPPDGETYSKALNAGQFPLSVLALTPQTAGIYVPGVYGNTMTTNPRALAVGCAVLDSLTDELRRNIRLRGTELRESLEKLAADFPHAITGVSGTGLMVCAELNPELYPVAGENGFERRLREHGIAMIHGGSNGLRFTPHFAITPEEISLITSSVRDVLEAINH